MNYSSFLLLIQSITQYLFLYPKSMRKENFLIEHSLARNSSEVKYIKKLFRKNCTTNYIAISIFYLHYRKKDICLENAIGTRMYLSWIIRERTPYRIENISIENGVQALENFIYDV